mmetsp:Transcript_32737/g.63287  ORF Transcript_32737/g.63287 Transcript_32737/m.63287 type:complete len:614 (+) Transcript_32737:69-1910(+)
MPSLVQSFCRAFVAGSLLTRARSAGDCVTTLARTSMPGGMPKAIPVPNPSGFVVVWEQGDAIKLQRFDESCMPHGKKIEVVRNASLWSQSDRGGLAAAVGLGNDTVAVAWILGQDVFVRMVNTDGLPQPDPVLASDKDKPFDRAEVRLVANPVASSTASPRFVAAWSSWRQDCDGWGVFARPFGADGTPMNETVQVNEECHNFQWHPQLAWCGNTAWALWVNGSDESCGLNGQCPVPFIRPLTSTTGIWKRGPKAFPLKGDGGPLAAALACNKDGNEATVLVYYPLTRRVRAWFEKFENISQSTQPQPRFDQLRINNSLRNLEMIKQTFRLHGLVAPVRTTLGVADASPSLQPEEVELLAQRGLLLLLGSSNRGTLSALLAEYDHARMEFFPKQQLALGAWNVRAALGESNNPPDALVFCFSVGSDFSSEEDPSFKCVRRTVEHLKNPHGFGWGVEVATTLALALVVVACCMGHCLQQGRVRRLPLARLTTTGTRTSRAVRRGITRRPPSAELRAQLARIPTAPVRPQPDVGPSGEQELVAGSVSGANSVAPLPPANINGAPCPICQSEVAMRVAFQPCGHTACRDCVHQLIERGHTCHICRAPLEGVLPVYI